VEGACCSLTDSALVTATSITISMSKNDDFAAVCTVAEAKSTIVGRKLRIVGK